MHSYTTLQPTLTLHPLTNPHPLGDDPVQSDPQGDPHEMVPQSSSPQSDPEVLNDSFSSKSSWHLNEIFSNTLSLMNFIF